MTIHNGSRLRGACFRLFLFYFAIDAGRANAVEQLLPPGNVLHRPAIRIASTAAAPAIDGRLDDACWQSAVAVRPLTLSYEGRFAPYQAEAMLTYDADKLYVALRCFDPDPARHPALPYPPSGDPFAAEFLIDAGIPESDYKIAINEKGEISVTQFLEKALKWKVPPAAAIVRSRNTWTTEFAIPFAGVDLPKPGTNGRWRVNMGWRTNSRLNYTAWAVTYAWFYEPQFFGDLYFGGPNSVTAALESIGAPQPGANAIPVTITNNGEQAERCEVVVSIETASGPWTAYHSVATVAPHGRQTVPAAYVVEDGLRGAATMTVRRDGAAEPFLRQSIPIDLAANRDLARRIRGVLAEISPSRADASGAGSTQGKTRIQSELDGFADKLSASGLSAEDWNALAQPLETLLAQAQKLVWRQDHANAISDAPFALGLASTMDKVRRGSAYLGPPVKVIDISAARGERECVQLLIVPLGADLSGVSVSADPLEGPEGAQIPAGAITAEWAEFVQLRAPRYPVDTVGWIEDPLVPMSSASRVVPAARPQQPIWLTVTVPHKIPAGVYTGSVNIRAANTRPVAALLRVRVYDFDLPLRPALRTAMWLNEDHIKKWYNWTEIPKDVHRKEMAFLLEHRVNPMMPSGPIGDEDDLEFQIERGLNMVPLGIADKWPLMAEMEKQIGGRYAFFKQRGLLDLVYIYGQDEPTPSDYPRVRDALEQAAKAYPGVRRLCTAFPPAKGLEGAVDTWVVSPNLFDAAGVAERQAAGDELWLYASATLKRPYVNLFMDYTGLENRLAPWLCWKYGATGFLYWGINEWTSNDKPWSGKPEIDDAIRSGKRWPEIPWNTWSYLNFNGEALLVYPGPNGDFWSSVRLEILRDAIDDYDYLALLRGARNALEKTNTPGKQTLLATADQLLTIGPPLASDLANTTRDPSLLLKRRQEIAEHIEAIRRAISNTQ